MKLEQMNTGDGAIAFFSDKHSVHIRNDGLLHLSLPTTIGWQEAKVWAKALLSVADTAEERGYPQSAEEGG